ncbi:MAG: 3-ketoacyl-ACP reductase, partial [Chloroflexi bacterium RBG_19FT_COMBO_47_9]
MKKVALVTGSRRGIGLATAKALSGADYKVLLSDIIEEEEFTEQLAKLRSEGHDFDYYKCDISNELDRRVIFEHVADRFGRLDVLVNNAGVAPNVRMDILSTTKQSLYQLLDINLCGTFFMCQCGANCMISMLTKGLKDYSPRIVNISSISAYTSSINRGEYCISKAGVSMVTMLFADKLAEYGIPVFEVRPGIILTEMTAVVKDKYEKLI